MVFIDLSTWSANSNSPLYVHRPECHLQVDGFHGASFQWFPTMESALNCWDAVCLASEDLNNFDDDSVPTVGPQPVSHAQTQVPAPTTQPTVNNHRTQSSQAHVASQPVVHDQSRRAPIPTPVLHGNHGRQGNVPASAAMNDTNNGRHGSVPPTAGHETQSNSATAASATSSPISNYATTDEEWWAVLQGANPGVYANQ